MKKIPRQKSNVSFYFSTRLRQWNRFLCRSVFRDHLLREPQLHSSSHGLWKDDPAQGTGQLGDFRAIQHEMIVSDTSQGTGRESNLYVIDWLANVVGCFLFFCLKFYLEHQSSCKRLACERLKLAENINRWPALLQQMASKRVHDNFITQQQIIVYPKFKIFGKAAMQSHLNGFKKLNKAVMVLSLHEWLKSEWVINVVKNNHDDFKSAWRPELI